MRQYDLAIIGAGPAGMAAAAEAAGHRLSVALLDEQPRAGGQIYRDVDRVVSLRGDILGRDYATGTALTAGLGKDGIDYIAGAVVWAIEDGFRISYTRDGRGTQIGSERILLATGALERPMPLPGWTLPGVMTAGAGQILLKQSGLLPRDAVLVGSGPLLYLIAAQMVRAGAPPVAMVETQTRTDMLSAARHISGAIRGHTYLTKGLKMLAEIRRAGVPRYVGATDIAIEGRESATGVQFTHEGRKQHVACATVLVHHGVVPNTQAARSLGIKHRWKTDQQAFAPVLDEWGQSDVPGVFIAGDGAGIGGASVAEIAGQLTAMQIATLSGHLSANDRDLNAAPLKKARRREMAIRPFLDAAYPPYAQAISPADNTIICRCEEVRAGDIRKWGKLGCLGPNQTKAFGRAGMGPCQGRFCGLTVTALLADANNRSPDETGYYRIRPPLKPITLGELAGMEGGNQDASE